MTTLSSNMLFGIQPSVAWGFSDLTQKDTRYITHGYHRYPAKYIPQLARKLILEHSRPGDFVVDPFGGCGTTAIEAKINNRRALAIDINPVAVMISNAKINALPPDKLDKITEFFWNQHEITMLDDMSVCNSCNERLNYWFTQFGIKELYRLLFTIHQIKEKPYQEFFLCAFSNILKNCSHWSMKSNKPLYDAKKIPAIPEKQMERQLRLMSRMNSEYYDLLKCHNVKSVDCNAVEGNAENIPIGDSEADLVVTSPPYVTSYEYADLHQLTAIWMGWADNLLDFRKNFIGSSYTRRDKGEMNSITASRISDQLSEINSPLGAKTAVYFSDMNKSFSDMYRILRRRGRACIVIGDTELRKVKIQNTQVFIEQMETLGFKIKDVICRRVMSKCIPSTRDSETGKFTSVKNSDKMAYPVEYIIIAEKK